MQEQRGTVRIDTRRDQDRRQLQGPAAKLRRILGDGDGVEVDDGVEAVIDILVWNPVPNGADVVPQVEVPGWLDPREHARHRGRVAKGLASKPRPLVGRWGPRRPAACSNILASLRSLRNSRSARPAPPLASLRPLTDPPSLHPAALPLELRGRLRAPCMVAC